MTSENPSMVSMDAEDVNAETVPSQDEAVSSKTVSTTNMESLRKRQIVVYSVHLHISKVLLNYTGERKESNKRTIAISFIIKISLFKSSS